jgi:rhodanese-related sulfurtransferase
MKNKLVLLLSVFILACMIFSVAGSMAGCSGNAPDSAQKPDIEEGKVNNISVDEAYGLISNNDGSYFILDVRSKEEYKEGHIKDSVLIPVDELENRLGEVPEDKSIIVYCRSGNRSAKASNTLVDNGFKAVLNVEGGITEWISKGYPVVKD